MTTKELIRAEIERRKHQAEESKMEWVNEGYNQNAFAEDCRISSFDKLLSFLDTLPDEPVTDCHDLKEAAEKYADLNCHNHVENETDWSGLLYAFKAGAEWQKREMMKIITKDDNLEEAGTQYVETYFRDIDWTPDVIKSCLEEAFISGGEYVFKKINYE